MKYVPWQYAHEKKEKEKKLELRENLFNAQGIYVGNHILWWPN